MKDYTIKFETEVGPMRARTQSQARIKAESEQEARAQAEAHPNVLRILSIEEAE